MQQAIDSYLVTVFFRWAQSYPSPWTLPPFKVFIRTRRFACYQVKLRMVALVGNLLYLIVQNPQNHWHCLVFIWLVSYPTILHLISEFNLYFPFLLKMICWSISFLLIAFPSPFFLLILPLHLPLPFQDSSQVGHSQSFRSFIVSEYFHR